MTQMKLNFDYDNIRLMITGAHGMIGTALENLLPNKPNIICPPRGALDLKDENKVNNYIEFFKPEYIIHLAAKVGGVKANTDYLGDFYTDNIRINTNVLHSAHVHGVKKVLSIMSTCVYPDSASYPLTEDQIHNGPPHQSNYTYAYTKRMLDIQSKAYRDQFGDNFITVVPNNLYGKCFDEDTEIMTTNGIKNIKDVALEESIYTLNRETFEVEISEVCAKQEIYSKDYYHFGGRGVDFSVTPEHQMFYATSTGFQKRNAEWFSNKAGKFFGQVKLAKHKPLKTEENNLRTIELKQYIDENHIIIKDCCKDFEHSSSKLFSLEYDSLDFASFCGWYISEGSVHKEIAKNGATKTQIRIAQNLNANPKYYKQISSLLQKMKIPHGKDNFAHYFASRLFLNFIESEIGVGSFNKKIPKYYFSELCSWTERLSLFESLMKGDGDKDGSRYSTSSKNLMQDFIHLCFLLGVQISNVAFENGCFRISIRKTNACIKYKNIKKYNSNIFRKFYCITVKKNNIIYAGRNYKFNWIGQCDNFDLENSHVIPAMMRKIYEATLQNEYVELWGDGSPLREFTYSNDLAEILLFLLENYNGKEPINVGDTDERSIKRIAEHLSDIFDLKYDIRWDTSKPAGQYRKPSSNEKFLKLLELVGQRFAYTDLESGLGETCEWFLKTYPNLRGM